MALCANCGNDIFGGKVCYKCGVRVGGLTGASQPTAMPEPTAQQNQYQPQNQQQYQPPNQQQQYQPQFQQQYQPQFPQAQFQPSSSSGTNSMAIASFVCAFFFFPLGIIFGHVALSQIKKTNEGGNGLATAGLILSYLAMFIVFLAL